MKRTTVINRPLLTRSLFPSEQSPKSGVMAKGDEVKIIGKVQGDAINGNNLWFLDEHKDFVWSGNVDPIDHGQLPTYGQSLKMTFTCDDYGAIDSIDNGIYDLAANDKIDSVECFINGPNGKDRVRRLFQLIKDGKKLDLGIHLTITSGKPMSNGGTGSGFVKDNGDFIDWDKYFKPTFDDGVEWLKGEIRAQIDAARKWETELCEELGIEGPVFTHLSSHHNSLTFYESGFLTLLGLASEYRYAVRTPVVQPKLKSILAVKIKVTLNTLTGKKLMKCLKDFNKTAEWPVPIMDYLDMRHYGPALGEVRQKKFAKWINTKVENKEQILSELIKSGKQHVEVVLHVRQGSKNDLAEKKRHIDDVRDKFREELTNNGQNDLYSGVDIKYFDGRTLEYWATLHHFEKKDYGKRSFLAQNVAYMPYPAS